MKGKTWSRQRWVLMSNRVLQKQEYFIEGLLRITVTNVRLNSEHDNTLILQYIHPNGRLINAERLPSLGECRGS